MYPTNFDRTMPIVEPSYDAVIVKPPERNITYGRMPLRQIIDSVDRDDKYPNPASYTYMLNNPITEVTAIELAQACIPKSEFAVNSHNNLIYFQESYDQILTATIPVGNYATLTDLATAIQTAMNAVSALPQYTVIVEPKTSFITIQSALQAGDNIFKLIFKQCSCKQLCDDCECCIPCTEQKQTNYVNKSAGFVMGFGKKNLQYAIGTVLSFSGGILIGRNTCFTKQFTIGDLLTFEDEIIKTVYTVVSIESDTQMTLNPLNPSNSVVGSKINLFKFTGTMLPDLSGTKYVSLYISAGNERNQKNFSNNKNIDGSFAVIFLTSAFGQPTIVNTGTTARMSETKYFNPPLRNVDRLIIEFKTHDGYLYDFNGMNHVLDLEFQALNQPGIYNTVRSNN